MSLEMFSYLFQMRHLVSGVDVFDRILHPSRLMMEIILVIAKWSLG